MKKILALLSLASLMCAKEEAQLAQILHISQNTMTYQEAQRYCSKLAQGNIYRIKGKVKWTIKESLKSLP